jgi:ornithine cyclodeaminase
MSDDSVLFLAADEVAALLQGQEAAVLQAVQQAYETHGRGDSLLPHSTCLRFPGGPDRMMALPAYLGGRFAVAGVKWIASFPGNSARGLERASGLVVLSSMTTGRPTVIVEGSVISATRTAASAALAARVLHGATPSPGVGLLGCGVINLETLRFLRHLWPAIEHVIVYDLSAARAARFAARCTAVFDRVHVHIVSDPRALLERVSLLSIATTAMEPHLDDLHDGPLRTVLHLSLRDIAPAVIARSDNVVDDAEHVCRAETSLHLAERLLGHRQFIRCALAAILTGEEPPKPAHDVLTIFSPFGLGILDLAVAQLVYERAVAGGQGRHLPFAATTAA